jgi:hypothetical protein
MVRFVSGQYANVVRHGGMLGYVLDGDITAAIANVHANIENLSWTPKMRQVAKVEPCP